MTDFVIEKDVPLPTGKLRFRYPFRDMAVGDSIALIGMEKYLTARQAAYSFADNHGQRFRGQKNGDGGRIWRIE